MALSIEQNVFGFQVAVDDTLSVQIADGRGHFGTVEAGTMFTEMTFALKVEKEFASVDVIEDKVEPLFRLKRRVQRDEEGMMLIVTQHVAFRHNMLSLVASYHGPFFQNCAEKKIYY